MNDKQQLSTHQKEISKFCRLLTLAKLETQLVVNITAAVALIVTGHHSTGR